MQEKNGYYGNINALKYKKAEDLEKGIEAYFNDCDEKKVPYTMSGLAYSLGLDRTTLVRYGDRDLFANQIKKAKNRVEQQLEQNALMGKGNPTFTIFNLKNNYGWKDQQEIKTTNEVSISPLESAFEKLVESKND